MSKLSNQTQRSSIRVFYNQAGTRLSATRTNDKTSVVNHKAYWMNARSDAEALYVIAIINASDVIARISDLQSHGQRDKRDLDDLVWTLPIPEYDDADILHRDLAAAAAHAETVAAAVPLTDAQHLTAKRRAIRAALAEDGVAAEIEALVAALLPL